MIDEKKIEEAAIDASIEDTNKGIVRDGYVISAQADHELGFQDGFKTGVNWFLDNLWHDASEEPKEGKLIIVDIGLSEEEIAFGSMDKKMFIPDLSSTKWEELCELFGYTRWFYIDDLLKGGK